MSASWRRTSRWCPAASTASSASAGAASPRPRYPGTAASHTGPRWVHCVSSVSSFCSWHETKFRGSSLSKIGHLFFPTKSPMSLLGTIANSLHCIAVRAANQPFANVDLHSYKFQKTRALTRWIHSLRASLSTSWCLHLAASLATFLRLDACCL